MRAAGGLVPLCAGAALFAATLAAGATVDRGSDRPPPRLTNDAKSIWMTEWTACWRSTMHRMAAVLHIPVRSGQTPQQAARRLSRRAVYLLYETEPETQVAADGCRNGILWKYYHPSS
jgi:hypothetical protein